ncbi:MAG TPA: hypothetical protein VE129_10250 [Thermoanaerobaculia bacterium]|nr:hypothetical protein [Thermoanaerobaculia bacterium]
MRTVGSFPSASVLLALSLAGAGCARPAPETRFLNFDPESSAGALTSGWSGFEKSAEGDTFVWAQAREATVTVLAGGPADRLIRFRVWPFGWPGAPPQTVAVWVNDVRLEAMTVWEGPRVYSAASPGPAWKSGANVLRFEFAWAEAPKDRIPGGGDSRTLAAAFDWIEILPASAEGSRRP